MAQRLVTATEFKAKCLALLDEVQDGGGNITITKRGKPVATLTPVAERPWKSLKGILRGKVDPSFCEIVDTTDLWDCLKPDGGEPG